MTRQIEAPSQLDMESPGRRDYWVTFEHDSLWGNHHMPLTVIVGPEAEPGRGLLASGANHGCEYEGPVAIKHLLRRIRVEDVRGRIILIPVLNVSAFRTGTRDSTGDDGVNLNRAFVDGAGVTPALSGITHRIAAFVREHIWPNVHIVTDIHSGGQSLRFVRCSSHHKIEDPAQAELVDETARWFGTPFVMIYQDGTPGLMVSEAEKLGKITIGTELGWGEAVHRDGVQYATHGILAAAINHDQLSGSIEPIAHHADGTQRHIEIIDPACYVSAPWPGHYEPAVDCGQTVRKGDAVGMLHDFNRIDDDPWPVRAGVDGIVVSQAWAARVSAGMHIVVVGNEI